MATFYISHENSIKTFLNSPLPNALRAPDRNLFIYDKKLSNSPFSVQVTLLFLSAWWGPVFGTQKKALHQMWIYIKMHSKGIIYDGMLPHNKLSILNARCSTICYPHFKSQTEEKCHHFILFSDTSFHLLEHCAQASSLICTKFSNCLDI